VPISQASVFTLQRVPCSAVKALGVAVPKTLGTCGAASSDKTDRVPTRAEALPSVTGKGHDSVVGPGLAIDHLKNIAPAQKTSNAAGGDEDSLSLLVSGIRNGVDMGGLCQNRREKVSVGWIGEQ
jgi:hypothetical protein